MHNRYIFGDCKLVTAILNIRKLKLERKPVALRKIKNVTFNTFQQEIRSEKLNCDSLLDSMAKNLNIELRRVLDTLAPEQTQTILSRPKQPWYTEYVNIQHKVMRNRKRVCTDIRWRQCGRHI